MTTKFRMALGGWLVFFTTWFLLKAISYTQKVDNVLFTFFQNHRTAAGDLCLTWTTYAGNWNYVLIVAVILCLSFAWQKRWGYLLLLVVMFGGIETLIVFLKILIARERPFALLLPVAMWGSSFPSGHSALAVTFYGVLVYIWRKHLTKIYQKRLITGLGIVLIGAIAFSRIYLSAHWTSDVIAGLSLGFGWLFLVVGVYEKRLSAQKAKERLIADLERHLKD